jgi:hypothetical protein
VTTYSLTKSKWGCVVVLGVGLGRLALWGLGIHTAIQGLTS